MKKGYTCGDCRFFCREKVFEKPCDKLGQIEIAKSCNSFKPATQKFDEMIKDSENTLELLAKLMRKIPSSTLHILSSVIHNERTTRKFGYCFMQRVYIRHQGMAGANYVENFLACHILEASRAGLRIMSADGQTHILKTEFKKGEITGPNIYSQVEFKKLRVQMVKDKKLKDPALKRKKIDQSYLIEEPKKPKHTTTRQKQYTGNDLVTMTQDIERGHITTASYRRKRTSVEQNSSGHFTIGD